MMAKGNLPAVLAETLAYEGGWSDHPADPGGATMKGITLAVYRRYRPGATKADLRAIPSAEVERIYREGYWNQVRGDDLVRGVDLTVFDYGVNSGPARSVKALQQVAGVGVDGIMGPATVLAARGLPTRDLIKRVNAKRLGFVQSLSTFAVFGKGWSRRIAAIEATSLSWVSTKPQLEADAKDARTTAQTQAGGAVVTSGAGAADQANHLSSFPVGVVIAVVVVVVGILIFRVVINSHRAAALAKVAKEA
ncbi:Phage protein [Devosia sp. DBB001]|nr:Phage protein [Devosia sp. DBB001]